MIKLLSFLQPLVDHLYIFQLLEYHSVDLLKWFFKHPFKRRLQRKQQIEFTAHIKILLLFSLILMSIFSYILSAGFSSFFLFIILFMQISPLFIVVAELLFKPLELFQTGRIVGRAVAKRKRLKNLHVIAIVGSYAKTSTKNMLYTLLWKDFRVVKTPKSYNTELSIARSMISDLKDNTEIFICEMDAYQKGEIARLCQIAGPTKGIITAIGPQHLSRFGSMENLAATQFEVAEFSDTNQLFLNEEDEWSKKLSHHQENEVIWYNNRENFVSNTHEHDDYQTFRMHLGKEYADIHLPLKGAHNSVNFLAAAVIARNLGVSLKTIQQRARLIRPTEHRLEVRQLGEMTLLDNTYNANPKAALASLALLDSYKKAQKILVTPGFVELGKEHDREHRLFASAAAKIADDIIIVGYQAKKPLLAGLTEAKFDSEHIHFVETTQQGLAHISQIKKSNKVTVLLENDLPDQYF